MERLTEQHFKNTDGFYMKCSEHCERCEIEDFHCDECKEFGAIVDRLGEIENILGEDYNLDRLRELVQADRDGRCVVLPCKIGDKIYTTHHYKDGSGFVTEATVSGMHIKDEFYCGHIPRKEYIVCRCNGYSKHIPMDHIGKRAFFSYKSAKATLKGYQNV